MALDRHWIDVAGEVWTRKAVQRRAGKCLRGGAQWHQIPVDAGLRECAGDLLSPAAYATRVAPGMA